MQLYQDTRLNAKELKDDRLPVSKHLLEQLCNAADLFLTSFTKVLAKSLFLCTWGFTMRISEYSKTTQKGAKGAVSHNVQSNSIRTSDIGLSIAFHSDKTFKFSHSIKHRTVTWGKLLTNARSVIEEYISLRPQGAHTFFCKFDGRELLRSDVLNLLNVCILGMDWHHLKISPHSFRLGFTSESLLAGESVSEIRNQARWTEKTKAFEAYACSDLVELGPQEIYNIDPKYHRKWSAVSIKHLMQCVVESPGLADNHPFTVMLKNHFNDTDKLFQPYLPTNFPHEIFLAKCSLETKSRNLGTYSTSQLNHLNKARKAAVCNFMKRQTLAFHYAKKSAKTSPFRIDPVCILGETQSVTVQAVKTTNPVVILQDFITVNEGSPNQRKIHPEALGLLPNLKPAIASEACSIHCARAFTTGKNPKKHSSNDYKWRKCLKSRILRRISPRW